MDLGQTLDLRAPSKRQQEWEHMNRAEKKHALYLHFEMKDNASLTPAIIKRTATAPNGVGRILGTSGRLQGVKTTNVTKGSSNTTCPISYTAFFHSIVADIFF